MMMGFDRTLLPIIIGPIVSFLLFQGDIRPVCQEDVSQALHMVFGTIILLVSFAFTVFHPNADKDQSVKAKMTILRSKIKKFLLKDKQDTSI